MNTAAVIDFAAEDLRPPAALKRMRLVSRGLEILFLLLAVGFGLVASVVILDFVIPYSGQLVALGPAGGLLRIGPHPGPLPPHYLTVDAMPTVQRLAQVPVGLLHAAPIFILFWSLRRLFGLYAKGVVFAPDNARSLKHVGAALIVIALAPWLGHAVLGSLNLAIDQAWMHGSSVQELILGAVVYVIAQVMQLGRELEEERSQFV